MSTQIAVRLPDEMVRSVDALVSSGRARSRASVVEAALTRELRRFQAARDVEILRAQGGDDLDDLADLAAWATGQPVEDLD